MDNLFEDYEKHDLPSLSDEVWRLRRIDRSGSRVKCLHKESIKTVQDFLKKCYLDREGLQDEELLPPLS